MQVPEYSRTMDEKDIRDHAFEFIFAFDEIVALGYRESVNLAQIRTFTEMDSHEERVFYQIKKVATGFTFVQSFAKIFRTFVKTRSVSGSCWKVSGFYGLN